MYQKILFGIDPAGTALGATPVVAAIAHQFGSEVIALEIIEFGHDYDYAYDSDAEPAALAYEVARDLQRLGVSATAEVGNSRTATWARRSPGSPRRWVPTWWRWARAGVPTS